MRTIAIVALSAALAAAIVSGLILYQRSHDTHGALLMSEEKVVELSEKLSQLNRETATLHDQIKECEGMRTRVSELEHAITQKDNALSELNNTILTLTRECEKERKITEQVTSQLTTRNTMVTELEDQVQGLHATIRCLEEEVAQSQSELEELHGALLMSEEKVVELSEKLSQLNRETATLHDQIKECEGMRTRVSELEHAITQKDNALSELNNTIRCLEEEVAQSQSELEELQGARARIAKLEKEISTKDTILTGYEKRICALERDLAEERSLTQSIEAELASRNATNTELQKQLRDVQSWAHTLEERLAEKHQELKELDKRLRILRGEKASAETSIDEMRSTYESLISDLKERIENQEVTIERFEQEISVTFVDRILFEFGRATITSEGRTILHRIGETLQTVKGKRIRVIGHTDDRPIHLDYRFKFPSNWELSSARASAVIRYLQEEIGLEPTRLEAVGRSFYDPVDTNQTPEGRARNRRVEIIIASDLQ
jgi:chemotaxis protein MotB